MYEKQGFYSGNKLKASQLDAMEDGIINAETIAMEAKELAQSGGSAGLYKHTMTLAVPLEDGSLHYNTIIAISPIGETFTDDTVGEYFESGDILSTAVDWINPMTFLKAFICGGGAAAIYSVSGTSITTEDIMYVEFSDIVTEI